MEVKDDGEARLSVKSDGPIEAWGWGWEEELSVESDGPIWVVGEW